MQRQEVQHLVNELVLPEGKEHGVISLTEHSISLSNSTFIKHRPRIMLPMMLRWLILEVKKLLEQGIIEQAFSEWSTVPVILQKGDGSLRWCFDFSDLNEVTIKDAHLNPSIDGILDNLRRFRYISKIDLKMAYQVPMAADSKHYTAFSVPDLGLFQFKQVPFGLTST